LRGHGRPCLLPYCWCVDRGTVAALALRVGRGAAELHDRLMLGLRVNRLELDELWAFVGKKQRRTTAKDRAVMGDQYTFIALASTSKAIVSYRTGKRDGHNTDELVFDRRDRVLGTPEISTDGLAYYGPAIRAAFGKRVAYGQINKTYSVVDLRKDAAHPYSPAEVVAVERDVVSGVPSQISTSYVERQHLSIRTHCKRFARLTLSFSKRLENHAAAVSLHVAFYNFVRVHESLGVITPAMALGISDHPWSIGELIDAAVATQPIAPETTAPDRRRRFRVIEGGKGR
jgi:IS1 family transposase